MEIANCELYGWGIAIYLHDKLDRLNLENAASVWIHDNFIHHNRHYEQDGYGVETKRGYALIERNVFDYNRHAIAAGSQDGTGYLAYHNLVLENGGEGWDTHVAGYYNTHMFDVHGADSCFPFYWDQYCGQAGEYFDYRHNTFYYDAGVAIKIRGEPTRGAEATRNVFDDPDEWEGPLGGDGAFAQTDGGNLDVWDNQFDVNALDDDAIVSCDFDGDGLKDRFLATGATWWYRSAIGHWTYLHTSSKRVHELTLADLDGDARCDVKVNAGGTVFSGGKRAPAVRTDLLLTSGVTDSPRVWRLGPGGGTFVGASPVLPLDPAWTVKDLMPVAAPRLDTTPAP